MFLTLSIFIPDTTLYSIIILKSPGKRSPGQVAGGKFRKLKFHVKH
jgi:hypothetical protein